MQSPTLSELGSVAALTIDADALCQIAEDAVEQDKASSMADGLVLARHRVEMMVARVLDAAHNEALNRHITPRSIEQIREDAEIVPHITAAQADDMRLVLTRVGQPVAGVEAVSHCALHGRHCGACDETEGWAQPLCRGAWFALGQPGVEPLWGSLYGIGATVLCAPAAGMFFKEEQVMGDHVEALREALLNHDNERASAEHDRESGELACAVDDAECVRLAAVAVVEAARLVVAQ